jgi:hypothetical protein
MRRMRRMMMRRRAIILEEEKVEEETEEEEEVATLDCRRPELVSRVLKYSKVTSQLSLELIMSSSYLTVT